MRKWLMVLGLAFFLMMVMVGQSFAVFRDSEFWNKKRSHAVKQVGVVESGATEKELARVKKLAEERVAEAKKLRIFEKADTIVEVLTKSGKTDFSDTSIHISRETRSEENTVKIIIYDNRCNEVFRGFRSHNGLLEIGVYRPGNWQQQVDLFYTKTQKIKINDLKNRYKIK